VHDTSAPLELQWYVIASGGGTSIHMPMYFKANPTLPDATSGAVVTETFTGSVIAGDAGMQHDSDNYLAAGVTYNDVPFQVPANSVKVDAKLEFTDVAGLDFGLSDLDLYLVDPSGNIIAGSAIAGGPENISVPV